MSKRQNAAARPAPTPTRAELLRQFIPDELFTEPPDLFDLVENDGETWKALLDMERGPNARSERQVLQMEARVQTALPEHLKRDFVALRDEVSDMENAAGQAGFAAGYYYAMRQIAARMR